MKKILIFSLFFLSVSFAQVEKNISVYRGDSTAIEFKVNGNITNKGIVFVVKLSKSFSSPRLIQKSNLIAGGSAAEITASFSAPQTKVTVYLGPEDTEDLEAATYYYDIIAADGSNLASYQTFNFGKFTFLNGGDVQTPFDGTSPPTSGTRFWVAGTFIDSTVADSSLFMWDSTSQTMKTVSRDELAELLGVGDVDLSNVVDKTTAQTITGQKNFNIIKVGSDTVDVGKRIVGMVNVKEFGAVGDGVTNDSTVFKTVIDYARINKTPIIIPPGTYIIGTQILYDSVSISGQNNNAVIKSTDVGKSCFVSDGADNWDISNLKFIGSNSSSSIDSLSIPDLSQIGISILNASNGWKINNCDFSNFKGSAIKQTNSSTFNTEYAGGTITNSNFWLNNRAIDFRQYAEYNIVSNCQITKNVFGIYNIGGNNKYNSNSIRSNYIGLYIGDGGNDSHGNANSNDFNHNTYGIYAVNTYIGYTFSGNSIFNSEVYLYAVAGFSFVGNNFGGVKWTQIGGDMNCFIGNTVLGGDTSFTISNAILETFFNFSYNGPDYGRWSPNLNGLQGLYYYYPTDTYAYPTLGIGRKSNNGEKISINTNSFGDMIAFGDGANNRGCFGWQPGYIFLKSPTYGFDLRFGVYNSKDSAIVIQSSTGYVGINNANPQKQFDVKGSINADSYFAGLSQGYLSSSPGTLTASGLYVATSSGGTATRQLYYRTIIIDGVEMQILTLDIP